MFIGIGIGVGLGSNNIAPVNKLNWSPNANRRSGLATCIGPDGTTQWGPHNLLTESSVLVTQSVAVAAGSYIVSFSGTGSVTLSGAATGTINGTSASNRVYLLVSTTAGTLTSTVTGSVTSAQLETVTGANRTTPSDYVDSTVKNRLGYSNDFANAAWTKTNSTPYPATTTQSDGTPATLLCDNATSGLHFARQDVAVTAGSWAVQIRAKQAALRFLWISMDGGSNTTWFNLATGAVGTNNAGTTMMVLGPDGFYTCQLVRTLGAVTAAIFYGVSASDAVSSYVGTGQGVYIANACLSPGPSAANYAYNAAAAPAVGPLYAQRTDYDPVTLACKGALIEAQATQLLANPDDLSASPWGGSIVCTDDGKKFRGRRFWKCAKTTTGTSEFRQNTPTGAQAIGYYTKGLAFMASANCNQIDFGLLGGLSTWGAAGDTMCSIDSGPGTLTQQVGGLWRIAGLSTDVPTIITMTRNILVSETVGVFLYPDTSTSATIGKAVYCQVDNLEAGRSKTSFIPNPATIGSVVRVADTSSVGYDDLCKALPWLMAANSLTNPEDQTLWAKVGATAPNANTVALGTGNLSYSYKVSSTAGAVGAVWTGSMLLSGTPGAQCYLNIIEHGGVWPATTNLVTLTATPTIYTVTRTLTQNGDFDLRILDANQATTVTVGWAKLNPGPVAQTYYPQASKQATIVFEGDLTYGSTAATLFCLENTVSNRVLLYKPTAENTLYGYINGNGVNSNQAITSGVPFKAAIGFSLASAGITVNGSSEAAITPGAFALAPNILRLANDATNNGSGSVRIKRLRIFNTNLPASTKQALTR